MAHGGASLLCVLSIIIQKPVNQVGVHRMYSVLCKVVFLLYAAPDYMNISNRCSCYDAMARVLCWGMLTFVLIVDYTVFAL